MIHPARLLTRTPRSTTIIIPRPTLPIQHHHHPQMSTTTNSNPNLTPNPLPHHDVVSSFLCTHPSPSSPSFHISIFKRSSSVRVYKNLWAACSGSIDSTDASPKEAALREIYEETGVRGEQLRLLREGEWYEVLDEEEGAGKRWRIWVFAWLLVKEGEGGFWSKEEAEGMVRLDWEHTECRFVRPEEVEGMETVAHLGRSVKRVLEGL